MRPVAQCYLALLALVQGACSGDTFAPTVPVSVALDSLPFPAAVVGDTLRDSSGVATPLRAKAFNYRGDVLAEAAFRYTILDPGAHVDSVTGVVIGDSVRPAPVRIVASLADLQTAPVPLAIVIRPDSLAPVVIADTVRYSLTDSTVNVSKALNVRLLNLGPPVTGVPSWLVSYRIASPADTSLAFLVGDGVARSRLDTTGSDGTAGRRVRIRPANLAAAADSVVVFASARYRGAHVRGSPERIIVHLRPPTP